MTNQDIREILMRGVELIDYYERVAVLPNCNDCGIRLDCEYVPQIGEMARINCPLWVGMDGIGKTDEGMEEPGSGGEQEKIDCG